VTATVAQDIDYLPYGGVERYTLGNGLHVTRQFDPDYRLTELQARGDAGPVHHLRLSYDAHDQITAIQDLRDPARSQTFGYDALSRLRSARGAYGEQAWTYDPVGNRLRQTHTPPAGRPTTHTYHYPADSHRLAAISGTHALTLDYDAAGHTTQKGDLQLHYNAAQRPVTITQGRTRVSNVYNAAGQRARKTVDTREILFHYAPDGQLLAETEATGSPLREYIYLDQMPLSLTVHTRKPGRAPSGKGPPSGQGPPPHAPLPDPATTMEVHTYYVHPDHLGTPQRLTDRHQQIVWDAVYAPFGEVTLRTEQVMQPLRFPGQYADPETGLHQNWHRDYDPGLGRYLQSDPIGLSGGVSTFGYAFQNPVHWYDLMGLEVVCVDRYGYTERSHEMYVPPVRIESEHCMLIPRIGPDIPGPGELPSRGRIPQPWGIGFEWKCEKAWDVIEPEQWETRRELWQHHWVECTDTCTGKVNKLWNPNGDKKVRDLP
jgi:RHS repeat-associated protein